MSRFSKTDSTPSKAAARVSRAVPASDVQATAIVSVEAPDGSTPEHEVLPAATADTDDTVTVDADDEEPVKKRRLGRRKNKGEQHG
jgi:hypothetical protein